MVTPGTRINEYGAEGGGKPSSGDLSMFDEVKDSKKSGGYTEEFPNEGGKSEFSYSESEDGSESNIKTSYEGVTNRFDMEEGKAYILGTEVSFDGYNELLALPEESKTDIDVLKGIVKKHRVDKIEPVNNQSKIEVETKNKNLDLSSNDIDGDVTQAIAKTNERIDNLIGGENKEQNNGNLVSANKPNVTEATLKVAAAPLPFVKVIKNNQLSTSPKSYNGLPPEIAAMIS